MYSQEDSPVSRFQSQDNEKDRRMTVTSGRKCSVLYERYDPLGSLVRTLLESYRWYNPAVRLRWKVKPLFSTRLTRKRYSSKNTLSRPYAEILNVKDIPSSRFLFQLAVSERRTRETGYGLLPTVQTQGLKVCDKDGKTRFMNLSLLPTPTAQEGFNSGKGEIFVTRNNTIRVRNQNGTSSRLGLEGVVKHMLYPTPTAQDFKRRGPNSKQQGLPEAAYKKMLPTPKTNSWKAPCEHGKGGTGFTDGYSKNPWLEFPTQPPVRGRDDGLPFDVDYLAIPFTKWRQESIKAYGNAIVPQVAFEIFKAIETSTFPHS